MTTSTTDPSNQVVLLDDLLLDAQHELEFADCPSLGQAVADARTTLIRFSLEHQLPPMLVPAAPDEAAPELTARETLDDLADYVAELFHEEYERLSSSLSRRRTWRDVPTSHRDLLRATAAAVLRTVFPPEALATALVPDHA